ncbi:unnamed protein product [Gordionus sp. m RMFG-2023]
MFDAFSCRTKLFSTYISSLPTLIFSENEQIKTLAQKYNPDAKKSRVKIVDSDIIKPNISELVLWKKPLITLNFFMAEILIQIQNLTTWLLKFKDKSAIILLSSLILLAIFLKSDHKYIDKIYKTSYYYLSWFGLGILSSIGIGTGLHTFILYLGPFLANVTIAAHKCQSLNFPSPPYPDKIWCPKIKWLLWMNLFSKKISIFNIYSKVYKEVLIWGFGTAIGELPAYFLGRNARLTEAIYKKKRLSKTFEKFIECDTVNSYIYLDKEKNINESPSLLQNQIKELPYVNKMNPKCRVNEKFTIKKMTQLLVDYLGFMGILAFASIPNPFFDFAGLASGHGLMPFWKFFLAIIIGKAFIKSQCQSLIIIMIMSDKYLPNLFCYIKKIPKIGLRVCLYLQGHIQRYTFRDDIRIIQDINKYEDIFTQLIVIIFVAYFLINAINSLAQANLARTYDQINEFTN